MIISSDSDKSDENEDGYLLMFSGGRDSTLAAVRIARTCQNLILATVTSDHLVGYEQVVRRLREMQRYLPPATRCIRVLQPDCRQTEILREPTCLPCHREYVTAGVLLAKQHGIRNLAFGYVRYQNTWPEQTEYATSRLAQLLTQFGIHLHLPVHDITTRQEAINELIGLSISPDALEQKCLQQQWNEQLLNGDLQEEIDRWEQSTIAQLERIDEISLTILSDMRLGEF